METVFSWFRTKLGGSSKGQWLNVTTSPLHEAAESAPAGEGSRRALSLSDKKASSGRARPNKHRRNQSEGTHVAKMWKQANTVTLEDFELLSTLGQGGFGKVLLVKKKSSQGPLLALKVMRKADLIKRDLVEAIRTEHQILHTLNHPFMTSLQFAWQTDDKLYLCMDYCPGGELFFLRQRLGIFSLQQVHLYCAEISLALGCLHSHGFIYRDLKLENLLLDAHGHIRLTDFGLTKQAKHTNTFCGTPEYVAPEMVLAQPYTNAVDWWALGTLAYEMLVGAPPFFTRNQNTMYHKILHAPLSFPASVPESAQRLITDLLQRSPAERLGSAAGVDQVRRHPFFSELDWERVLRKGYVPIFQPTTEGDAHVDNFDPVFTQLPVRDSSADLPRLDPASTHYFEGFAYCRTAGAASPASASPPCVTPLMAVI